MKSSIKFRNSNISSLHAVRSQIKYENEANDHHIVSALPKISSRARRNLVTPPIGIGPIVRETARFTTITAHHFGTRRARGSGYAGASLLVSFSG